MSCPDWIQHIPFDIYFYVLQKNERTYYSQKQKICIVILSQVNHYKWKQKRNSPNRDLSII